MKINTRRMVHLGMLAAIALIMFVIELQIPNPFPIPGIKLGFANIVTVYCLYKYKPSETAMVLAVRIVLGAFFAGNVFSIIYSASGAILCFIGSVLLVKIIPEKFLFLASMAGGVLHNTGQLIAATFVMGTKSVWGYYPYLIIAGILTGALTGLIAQLLLAKLKNKFF